MMDDNVSWQELDVIEDAFIVCLSLARDERLHFIVVPVCSYQIWRGDCGNEMSLSESETNSRKPSMPVWKRDQFSQPSMPAATNCSVPGSWGGETIRLTFVLLIESPLWTKNVITPQNFTKISVGFSHKFVWKCTRHCPRKYFLRDFFSLKCRAESFILGNHDRTLTSGGLCL